MDREACRGPAMKSAASWSRPGYLLGVMPGSCGTTVVNRSHDALHPGCLVVTVGDPGVALLGLKHVTVSQVGWEPIQGPYARGLRVIWAGVCLRWVWWAVRGHRGSGGRWFWNVPFECGVRNGSEAGVFFSNSSTKCQWLGRERV